jgi:hypothetical protein
MDEDKAKAEAEAKNAKARELKVTPDYGIREATESELKFIKAKGK